MGEYDSLTIDHVMLYKINAIVQTSTKSEDNNNASIEKPSQGHKKMCKECGEV